MRDDPGAVDLRFEVGASEAIGATSFLRPTPAFAAIPRLIDRFTVPDPRTRVAAEGMLRRGPARTSATPMQARYRAWWLESKVGFRPRYRAEKSDPFPAEEPEAPKP